MSNTNANESATVTSRKARRVYPYKGHLLVCFAGQRYQSELSAEDSALNADEPAVKIVAAEGDEAPATIEVTQRKRGQKSRTETWSLFEG